MHGRIAAIASLILTIAAAAPAAHADEVLGTGQAASADGVVTSWTVVSPSTQTARLASTQTLMSGTATTATSASVTLTAGTSGPFAVRVPVAAGGQVSVLDASGTSGLQATVEPDADGDGFGDTTQDACLKDFTSHAAPCWGTETFGSPLTLAPDGGLSSSGGVVDAFQLSAAGTTLSVGAAGILTHWRLRSDPAKADTVLQVLRPQAGGGFVVVDESPVVHVTDAGVVSVPAQIAVRPGDRIGARSVARGMQRDLGATARRTGDQLVVQDPPASKGQTWSPDTTTSYAYRLLVQADVEPDADADGKGDVSQDAADLHVTGAEASGQQRYVVANGGPDAALRVTVRLTGAPATLNAPAGADCATDPATSVPGGVATVCTLARIDAGAAAAFTLGAAQTSDAGGLHRRSSAAAAALTTDPDAADNAAALASDAAPYVPSLPPTTQLVAPACAHLVRGTRDDDVLRGTVFGDRLVGGEGGDLLKGGGGDDCLEGGAGADVLDGGDGNDHLAGGTGKDRLAGGTGNDSLKGSQGNDRLSGGPGNDTISPGSGRDSIDAGSGNDTINAVDGVRETVECGRGLDRVRADRRDRLRHCEKITRRP
jgi:hypothetical protein